MYLLAEHENVVRIPPERLGEDLEAVILEQARSTFEGRVENGESMTVLIRDIRRVGEGRIVHGDGAVYQNVRYQAIIFKPVVGELVEGNVVQIIKFGAFVGFGPLDGLIHISQIADDRFDADEGGQRLIGKETKREIRRDDDVRARIVSIQQLNEKDPRDSKIGLTMRQNGLGAKKWPKDGEKKVEAAPAKPKKGAA
jgi:DNA-directed RNA polymerase subunit E'